MTLENQYGFTYNLKPIHRTETANAYLSTIKDAEINGILAY
ncbi:hypothetical protein ACQKMI_19105 [Lysinibacillus sp. NPDC097214]